MSRRKNEAFNASSLGEMAQKMEEAAAMLRSLENEMHEHLPPGRNVLLGYSLPVKNGIAAARQMYFKGLAKLDTYKLDIE